MIRRDTNLKQVFVLMLLYIYYIAMSNLVFVALWLWQGNTVYYKNGILRYILPCHLRISGGPYRSLGRLCLCVSQPSLWPIPSGHGKDILLWNRLFSYWCAKCKRECVLYGIGSHVLPLSERDEEVELTYLDYHACSEFCDSLANIHPRFSRICSRLCRPHVIRDSGGETRKEK